MNLSKKFYKTALSSAPTLKRARTAGAVQEHFYFTRFREKLEEVNCMKVKEILEMVEILTGMSEDWYTKCKYMILLSAKSPCIKFFFTELFARADDRRPKLLEMK